MLDTHRQSGLCSHVSSKQADNLCARHPSQVSFANNAAWLNSGFIFAARGDESRFGGTTKYFEVNAAVQRTHLRLG